MVGGSNRDRGRRGQEGPLRDWRRHAQRWRKGGPVIAGSELQPDRISERPLRRRSFFCRGACRNVRYWPLADITSCSAHVRYWGQADNRKSLGAGEVLRLFVIAITAPIICSYRAIAGGMPAFCGGDNEVQLSNKFERIYADSRLRTPTGGQCCRRAN